MLAFERKRKHDELSFIEIALAQSHAEAFGWKLFRVYFASFFQTKIVYYADCVLREPARQVQTQKRSILFIESVLHKPLL